MRYRIKFLDSFLNVLVPICIGYITYFNFLIIPSIIKNYLADGLWSYALISALLIIWDRKPFYLWICIAILLGAMYEVLQYASILRGTADFFDLLTYLLFATFALLVNKKLLPLYVQSNPNNYEPES